VTFNHKVTATLNLWAPFVKELFFRYLKHVSCCRQQCEALAKFVSQLDMPRLMMA